MDALDGKRLQNLDEVLRQMNKTLATMETTLKDVGVAMTTAFGSATQQMVKNVQQAFRGAQLADMLGIDQAKLGISDLQKEIKLLQGNVDSHTLGTVTWNNKSSKWKYSAGKTKMTDEQEYAAREKLAVLNDKLKYSMMSQEELMRKIVELAGKATQEAEKESLAKQSGLKKSIQLYQQYAQEYLRLTEQMKRETSKDGTLTKRGQVLAAERSQYRQLMHEQAVEIRNARSEGVRLSQEEELKLEVAHRQKLRKIIEQYDKQTDDKKGTKGAQERALQEANTRKAMKEINRLLDDRNMKEANLAKEGMTEKYYDLQRRKIEEINKKIEEQKRLLGSYGISGERALNQLGGGEKQTDNLKRLIEEGKELEKEKKRLAKVQQEDAAWQGKQRANQAAMFAANGKAIEQQRQLADQIDRLTRKREELVKSKSGPFTSYDSRNYPFVIQIENKIEELKALQAQIERQFQGSMKAGESAFASTKAERDNAEVRKKIAQEEINASKQKAQKAKEAAAIQKKADSESMANQRRQIQIKAQLAAIDKNRITITKQSSDKEKALAAQQQADYKSLQSELSKLIARQKELNTVSRGSGSRAKDRLSTYTISESEKAMRRYADAVRNAQREQKALGNETDKMLPTIQRLASAFGIAFSVRGLAQFGKKLIETRGEFELQQVALRSILQNKQLADEIWDKTMQAALRSPFTAMQLTRYTKQLAAYRIETDKLFDTTKRLADISAGLGVDMQRLILAYGQVKAANYLRASEIRQFTEAGVNILGELSRYFTDTRDQMYDTAKVMEMVTKRMVKFEDVEAIFKRMTDQGGIFYNMQYVQSQTVRGQIAKLHDAYDQMLNSIGKANQGALRTFVGLLNNIVKNWREWKTAIDSIMWPLLISSVYKFGRGLFYANAAAIVTNKNVNALTRSGARLNLTLKKLFATISAHPIGAIITVAAAATFALWNHWKAVKAINNEYDEMNGRMLETQYRMTSYQEKIEKNNAILKDSKKSAKEHNEAQDENKKILSELQRDYPEVASGMTIANNGIIAMTNSMKEYNAQLRLQILLNERAKGSFWNKSLKKDLEGFDEEISKQQTKLAQYTNQAQRVSSELQNAIESGKVSDTDFSEALKSLMQMAAATSIEEYEKALEKYQSTKVKGDWASSALERELSVLGFGGGKYYFKTISQSGELKSSRKKVMEEIKGDYEYFGSYIREMALLSEDFTGKFALTAEEFINGNQGILQSMLYTVKEDGTVVMGELGYALSQAFADAASGAQTEQAAQEMIDEWTRQIKEKYGLDVKFGLKTKKETPTYDPSAEEKVLALWRKRIKLIEDMNKKYNELSKSVYGYAKSEQKVREAFQDAWKAAGMPFEMSSIDFTSDKAVADALKMFRGRIPNKILDELEKTISERESTIELNVSVRLREDFGKQMEKAFNDYELTLELDKLNLPKGLAADMWGIEETDLQDLRKKLSQMYMDLRDENGQLSDEAFKDYEKFLNKIDDLERKQQKERLKDYSKYLETQYSERVKIEMDYVRKLAALEAETAIKEPQKREIREGLKREFLEKSRKQDWEDFKGSEFYVGMMEDLEKQGSASLEVMRNKLLEMRENAENLSPRALKEVVNALEKIDELEKKRIPPLKRIREEQEKLSGIEIKDVYERIAANQEKLAQDEQEQKDLERMIMLEEERQKLEKQGVTLDRAKTNLSMFESYRVVAEGNLRRFKSDGSKESKDQLSALEEDYNQWATLAEKWADIVRILSGQATIDKQEGGSKYRGLSLSDLKSRRDDAKKRIKDLEGVIGKDEELVKAQKDLEDAWNDTWEAAKRWAQSINGIFDGVMDTIGYFSDSTSTLTAEWKEFGDTSISALTNLVSGIQAYQQANAAAKKAGAATGLFTANGLQLAMVILGVIIKIVQAIAKMHDARIDKEIEQSKERVDDLQKAYDRLEKSIEKTFDTVSYIREYNQEVQNLNEQIEEANNQIAAAQDYKSEDKKREAIEAAEDAKQQALDALDEIKQAQIEVFGGIGSDNYRSAAEGFVDAWKSAFLETGDGLQGLQDHFDEFLQDWFVKQATMRIAASNLEPLFRKIDDAVDQYGLGGADVIPQELQEINDLKDLLLKQTNEQLESLAGVFGLGGEGSLSGLAAGIQGMTEEQANILESYWNIVRAHTDSIDVNVARIADILGAGGRSTNPQIQYLESIASNTMAIREMLSSALTNEGNGRGFRSYAL